MAVERVESDRYPYLPVRVRIGEQTQDLQALVDTGFEGDLAVPEAMEIGAAPNEIQRWALADGSVVAAAVYYSIVQLGSFDPGPARVAPLGEEVVVGRGIIDRYRVTFDHGERVIAEP